jgi:hypothetical protein
MRERRPGIVDIVRDFIAVHEMLVQIVADARAEALRFEAVQALVGDDEASPLFRLKEACHAIFRPLSPAERGTAVTKTAAVPSGALLDLAIGSLFHEAMKLRENLYQQESYQPRIAALASGADDDANKLFAEFERIRRLAAARLQESAGECETLLDQTRRQLLRLMAATRDDHRIARALYEDQNRLGAVFEGGLDAVYERIYGSVQAGFEAAASSYAESAYFAETLALLEATRADADLKAQLRPLELYAAGMDAFMNRDYERSLTNLSSWIASEGARTQAWLSLAHSSLIHYPNLVETDDAPDLIERAKSLADEIQSHIVVGD